MPHCTYIYRKYRNMMLPTYTYQITASSSRPASKKRSPRTLNILPCDEAAPIAVCRFFIASAGDGRLAWRCCTCGNPGLAVELRFNPSGVFTRRIGLLLANSGWLLREGRGGIGSRECESVSSERGISESGGKTGNIPAFKYSLPSGLSSDCIYAK